MNGLAEMERVGVPVIDMQNGEELVEKLLKACEEWGCFRLVNHGVPTELMAEMKAVATQLFDLPEEIKTRTVHPTEPGKGYLKRNLFGPFFEALNTGDVSCVDEFCNRLDVSPHQREVINQYIKAIRDLAGFLGRKLMEGNGLAGDLFDGWCYEMLMNKYHYCPESVGLTVMPMHSDVSFLTILQDDENVNGLQVIDNYSGEFTPIDHVPGTLVVNIGDIGKAWSNDKYCNVKHRVLCFEAKIRYSIALLVLGPNGNKVEAPSKFVDSKHPRLYVPIDVNEYKAVRATTNLKNGFALELYKTSKT